MTRQRPQISLEGVGTVLKPASLIRCDARKEATVDVMDVR